MENLSLIGCAQAIFFAVLILSKKHKVLSDYFLTGFILLLGGQLFFIYCYSSGLFQRNPWIAVADIYYWTLLGPALLLYTRTIINKNTRPGWTYLLTLLPSVIVTIGFSRYIFDDPSGLFDNLDKPGWLFRFSVYTWFYNSLLFYALTIYLLRKHSRKIRHYFSFSKNVDLKWLYYLSNGFAVFLFFLLVIPWLKNTLHIPVPSSSSFSWQVLVIYVFGIGFYGYRQQGIFSNILPELENSDNDTIPTGKHPPQEKEKSSYAKSGLTEAEMEELSQKLVRLMTDEKLFFDFELNLYSLAKKLHTSTHRLSQVLNEKFKKNFFDFINDYRIEEVKNQLNDPGKKHLKIISIAYDCGFNSKSTFYSCFKRNTSMTPAQYRNNIEKTVNISQ